MAAGSVAVGVLAAGVAGGAYYQHWRTHPGTLDAYSGSQAFGPAKLGQEFVADFGLSGRTGVTIDITKVKVHVVQNTADATITVVRLTGHELGGQTSPAGTFDKLPSALGRWTISDKAQLVYVITPHRAGVVQVDGADITYRVGDRHQTQWAGIAAKATVPAPG